jgi:general secretion pathway protein H
MTGRAGFSLLELTVVLFIVGLLSLVVVPRMTGTLSQTRLKTASKDISAALRFARSRAATEKKVYTANFDLDAGTLDVAAGEATDGEKTGSKAAAWGGGPRSGSYKLPEGVKLETASLGEEEVDSGMFDIRFFPTGGSSGGEIILVNERERRYGVTVDLLTGSVRAEEIEPEGSGSRRRSRGVVVIGKRSGSVAVIGR